MALMYDVRWTMYDLRNSRALREDAEWMRAGCCEAVRGRSYKGTGGAEAPSGTYVRRTMDDVRFEEFARVARGCRVDASGML